MAEFKLNHLHFKTPDPKKTAQWYVDNVGATIVSEAGDHRLQAGPPRHPHERYYPGGGTAYRAVLRPGAPSHRHQRPGRNRGAASRPAAPRSWASSRWATAATSASSRAPRACGWRSWRSRSRFAGIRPRNWAFSPARATTAATHCDTARLLSTRPQCEASTLRCSGRSQRLSLPLLRPCLIKGTCNYQ